MQQYLSPKKRSAAIRHIRAVIEARRGRDGYFNPELFADPAWDILLELYAGALADEHIAVTKLCQVSGVPDTTALRWIGRLEAEGLVSRRHDPFDGRRVWLALSADGFKAMKAYWDKVSA